YLYSSWFGCIVSFFFFQAEDGIRDFHVTVVQTCALPIFGGFANASEPEATAAPVYVKLETSDGDIFLELDPVKAPITVANFVEYVKEGHYDGTIFHRVIPGFMAPGGGYRRYLAEQTPWLEPIHH